MRLAFGIESKRHRQMFPCSKCAKFIGRIVALITRDQDKLNVGAIFQVSARGH